MLYTILSKGCCCQQNKVNRILVVYIRTSPAAVSCGQKKEKKHLKSATHTLWACNVRGMGAHAVHTGLSPHSSGSLLQYVNRLLGINSSYLYSFVTYDKHYSGVRTRTVLVKRSNTNTIVKFAQASCKPTYQVGYGTAAPPHVDFY